ncbi:M24 family metallopeptidase [Streptosporangium sandarakinum]|uniref:M24 family metallopeptidase n=1 Tax=Streptosporangium sandarakinum TaxID=1260955 RepID=UPI003D94403B
MHVQIDYAKRLADIQEALTRDGIDALVATRLKMITHLVGLFVPWRSALVIPAKGEPQLLTVNMDAVRIREEGFMPNVRPYGRKSMMECAAERLRELGLDAGTVAFEGGYSWYLPEGNITWEEHQILRDLCPKAELVNHTVEIDRWFLLKDPAQIELMRQACAMCDAAQDVLMKEVRPGLTEIDIAGIAEKALRDAGSEFAWTFTGGQEIGSGHRSWTGACTPPTRKITQRDEFLVLDVHGMYGLMLGDVSHNAVLGKVTPEKRQLIDAYVQSCEFLLAGLKPGRTIGEVARETREFAVSNGWKDIIRGFGHGIGHFGNEWFPSFTDVRMPYVSDPDIVLEEGFMEVMALTCNLPGVGGMRFERPVVITKDGAECLSKTPIEPWSLS